MLSEAKQPGGFSYFVEVKGTAEILRFAQSL
jgi:hypothetical protein